MRLLVFHRGGLSGCLNSLLSCWQKEHPAMCVRAVDLQRELLGSRMRRLRALPLALRRGGLRVLRRSGAYADAVNRSLWLCRGMSELAQRLQRQESADASLALGTTFDAAWEGRPHFIYTDLTLLANLYYPHGESYLLPWTEWLPHERRALQRARIVFTHSRLVDRSITEQYVLPPDKARCVRCGANASPPAQPDPQRFRRRNILFVGVDWERKGGPVLIDAFRQVRRRHPDATLTVVGCRPELRAEGVEVTGPLSLQGVTARLGQASVFCMPSRREAFGYVYLEAMQAGLPVVASRCGPATEFVRDGHNGFTVPPDNCDQLADCLDRLLADPELCRELGERGRRIVETEYNWSSTCTDMTTAMLAAVAENRAGMSRENGPQMVPEVKGVLASVGGSHAC